MVSWDFTLISFKNIYLNSLKNLNFKWLNIIVTHQLFYMSYIKSKYYEFQNTFYLFINETCLLYQWFLNTNYLKIIFYRRGN